MFIQLCNAYENVAFATYGSVNLDEPINATVLNMSIHVFFFCKKVLDKYPQVINITI